MEYLPIDYFRRAWSAHDRGDLDAEIDTLKELVSLCQMTEDPADHYAEALRWLGNAYQSKNDLLRAHGYRLEALKIVEQLSDACDDYVEMAVRGDLGRSFIELNEWAEAESHSRAALTIAEARSADPSETCIYRLNLALIFSNTGRNAEALALGERVLRDASALENADHLLAQQHLNLASLHLHANRLDQSDLHARRALLYAQRSRDSSIENLARTLIGKACLKQWKRARREEHAIEAEGLLQQVLAEANRQHDLATVADTELELAELAGRFSGDMAARHCESAIRALEESRKTLGFDEMSRAFFGQWARVYDSVVEFQVRRGEAAMALNTSERSRNRLLLARLGQGRRNISRWSETERAALAEAQARYGTEVIRICRSELHQARQRGWRRTFGLRSVRGVGMDTDPKAVVDARNAYLAVHDKQRLYASRWANRLVSQPAEPADIQRSLQPQDAMIVFHTTEESILAFALTSTHLEVQQTRFSHADLAAEVQKCCDLIALLEENSLARLDNPILRREWWSRLPGQPHPEDIEQPLQRLLATLQGLFLLLISPLLPVLATKRNWVIVPHGALHRIPWSALWTGRSYLVESHNVALLPSATFAVALRRQPAGPRPSGDSPVLLLGAPDSPDDPLALPGAAAELAATRDALRLSATPIIGEQATKNHFVDVAPGARLIHLAAHHFFDASVPGLSFVKLAGDQGSGFLYGSEVAEMPLAAQLAVLSACDTARSHVVSGDEQYGMVRSFFAAGVRSVISTLWAVEDQSAATMFSRFHDVSEKVPLIEALADAQRRLMKEPPYDLPYFWAAYVLSGDWIEPLRLR